MRTQAAREQAVAVGHVHRVAGFAAGRTDRTRDQIGPVVQIALGVAHHRRLARGAAGGVDTRDPFTRNGEHAEGIVLAQHA
ncbi:hypothetical protein G6F22_019899 [Rhizopus arrhizus]|nr:hypothetical protein G6F22_019899 [Rhizopus arrhizus]